MPVAKFTQPDYTSQSGTAYPLNIDADFKVLSETGLDFAPRAADTPNMTVIVEAGTLLTATGIVNVGQQTSATIVAPVTPNNRIDRVVMNRTTGIINVVTGTPAVSPVAPAIPADRLPICQFTVIPLQTSILNSGITDERTFTVGAGTMAFQNASGVAITGGTASGVAITGSTFNALTTGNASGNIPVSNGTLNVNLNADMLEGLHASTTPAANIIPVHDSNGNIRLGRVVGIGTAPDTNHDVALVQAAQEIGEYGVIYSRVGGGAHIAHNAELVNGIWVYRNSTYAQLFNLDGNGDFSFYTAPSGTAGAAITSFAERFSISNTGQVNIGTPASGYTRVGPGIFRRSSIGGEVGLTFNTLTAIPAPAGATGLLLSLKCVARAANAVSQRWAGIIVHSDSGGTATSGIAFCQAFEPIAIAVSTILGTNFTEILAPVVGGNAYVKFYDRDGGNQSIASYYIVGYTV